MYNIVLHIYIYLFLWIHVLCDLKPVNNDRKHSILAIFISMFFGTLIFDWWWSAKICVAICTPGLGSSTVDQVLKYTKYPKYMLSTSTGQVLFFFLSI